MLGRFYHIHSFVEELGIPKKDCYVFGGTIRDRLLGRNIVDIDLVVLGDYSFDGLVAKLSTTSRIVLTKKDFSFIKLVLENENSTVVDLQLAKEIQSFLTTRDFTVNSLAVRLDCILRFMSVPRRDYVIDVTGGFLDLSKGILRTCTETTFIEDPVRILRAAYYAAKMKFQFDKSLVEQARRCLNFLKNLKKEKLRENFLSYAFEEPFKFFYLLDMLGVNEELFGTKLGPEKLKRIKQLSGKLSDNSLSKKEKSAIRVAILAEAGVLNSDLFVGFFSRKTIKKSLGISGNMFLKTSQNRC